MITLCCKPRGVNQLANPMVWHAIRDTILTRESMGWIRCTLALAMPDHLHAMILFPGSESMQAAIRSLKSWLAKDQSIRWQRDFFDHRVRSWESAVEKSTYIRMNPVRAGYVSTPDEWPYWM